MKQFTIKELSALINIPQGTIRAWIMKPVDNEPYDSNKVNYDNLKEKLLKYFDDFEKAFQFKIDDIEIIKSSRVKKQWMSIAEVEALKPGEKILMRNYSLKTTLKKVSNLEANDEKLIVFEVMGKSMDNTEYRCYSTYQLSKENIKLERV